MIPIDSPDLHLPTVSGTGIPVVDACPSREAFEEFAGSSESLGTLRDVDLPPRRVQRLGDLRVAHVRREVPA